MKKTYFELKNFILNKIFLRNFLKMKITNDDKAFCLGVNKEGVRCTKALDCARYIPNPTETKTFISFPENYDIKNCEIFINIKNEHQ